MSELVGLGVKQNLSENAMDPVVSALQTTDGYPSGGNLNHPSTGSLDQKDVDLVSGFIIGERDVTDGIHGLIIQEANAVNSSPPPVHPASLEAENCYGEYSTTSAVRLPCRISSPYDEVDKKLKNIFGGIVQIAAMHDCSDSVHEYIRSQVAAGNYQALNHEFNNGKGIRADYLRSLVRRHPKFKRGACLPDTAEKSSKMVDSKDLYQFSNACLTYTEIFKIRDYFFKCTINSPKDARSQEALLRDIKHGRGLYAQYLGAEIRAGIGGSVFRILEEMEKDGVCLKALAAMVSSKASRVNISPQNSMN